MVSKFIGKLNLTFSFLITQLKTSQRQGIIWRYIKIKKPEIRWGRGWFYLILTSKNTRQKDNFTKTTLLHFKNFVGKKYSSEKIFVGKKYSSVENFAGKKYSSVKNFVTKRFFRHFLPTNFLPIRYILFFQKCRLVFLT